MVSIDRLIFGYRVIDFEPVDSGYFAAAFLKADIRATVCCGRAYIPLSKYPAFEKIAKDRPYTASRARGLYALILSLKSRTALLISIFLAVLVVAFMSNVVWDVRIDGDEPYDQYIIDSLGECGLTVGKLFWRLDLSEIENALLLCCEDISWVNINRRGTVAYVKVIKRTDPPPISEPHAYSNIVAAFDGVIEEIDVVSGKAMVKVGDVVRRGDILISGILGGGDNVEFCSAVGKVYAKVNSTLTTFVPSEETKAVYTTEKLLSRTIKIFNFSINIFKNYRNSIGEYDIIENVEVYVLPGGIRLPIAVYSESARFKEQRAYQYSESELAECASYEISRQLDELIGDGELISLKSNGSFHDGGYTVITEVSYVRDVGVSSPLKS